MHQSSTIQPVSSSKHQEKHVFWSSEGLRVGQKPGLNKSSQRALQHTADPEKPNELDRNAASFHLSVE